MHAEVPGQIPKSVRGTGCGLWGIDSSRKFWKGLGQGIASTMTAMEEEGNLFTEHLATESLLIRRWEAWGSVSKIGCTLVQDEWGLGCPPTSLLFRQAALYSLYNFLSLQGELPGPGHLF